MSCVIKVLEPELINRIAAGEVIERPTSVIKELLENSLDAKATEIHVTLRAGGQSLMRVQDNGQGMVKEDLMLSVQRHTTSKLSSWDLWNVNTFGFRGEALASITSISRATLTSTTENQAHGWSLSIEGSVFSALKPAHCALGTCIEIRDIFFSTPARLKFLRSPAQEYIHLHRCLDRFLLLNPKVTFFLYIDEKKRVLNQSSLENRIKDVFRISELEGFWLEEQVQDIQVTGWAFLPGVHRGNTERLFFYVNQRPIEDRMLIQAVRCAYHDLIPKDRYPCGIIFITMPYQDVDVNVHPGKTHVRFKAPQEVRTALMTTLRKALFHEAKKSVSVHPKLEPSAVYSTKGKTSKERDGKSLPFPAPQETSALETWSRPGKSSFILQETHVTGEYHQTFSLKHPSKFEALCSAIPHHEAESQVLDRLVPHHEAESQVLDRLVPHHEAESQVLDRLVPHQAGSLDLGRALGQIHKRYILAVNEQGFVIVDPHGAHERILYEETKRRWKSFDVQFLIPPFALSLTEAELILVETHHLALAEIGFPLEHQENQWVLKGIPAVLHRHCPEELWNYVLQCLAQDPLCTAKDIQRTLVHKVLAYWSCRSSVFLGDALSLEEMNELLRAMERTPHSAYCNHGRRVYCTFSMAHIATWFERSS